MVQFGLIYAGGPEGHPISGKIFNSGVCFSLNSTSELDESCSIDNGLWEVEIKKGQSTIVARCQNIFPSDVLFKYGFEYCQRFLDLISINNKIQMSLKNPTVSHYLIFQKEGQCVLKIIDIAQVKFNMIVEIVHKDKNGNVIPPSVNPKTNWIAAFRYYRLSQISDDIFEAYRNLFLAFEFILNEICPKKPGEKEVEWLMRSLDSIRQKIQIENYVPQENKNNPIPYLAGTQYENIRCNLFHAKGVKKILPHENPDQKEISDAYVRLLNLFRQIAIDYFNVSRESTEITNEGFFEFYKFFKEGGFSILVTDDSTPPQPSDKIINPSGCPIHILQEMDIKKDPITGRIVLSGRTEQIKKIDSIHKFGIMLDDTLYCEGYIEDGLFILGIDSLEIIQSLGFINGNMPKTTFF